MPSRIVTYAHRYKRPPRKKAKAAAINAPAIVRRSANPSDGAAASTGTASTPMIVGATAEKGRRNHWVDDGREISPEVKAFFARMMRPP
jgi:hypothetical protein